MRILLLLCGLLLPSIASAYETVPAEKRVIPWVAELPLCGDPVVLGTISTRFAEKEAKFWNSSLTLVEYSHIKPLAWRPWGLDTIPRRYCTATVYVSDGVRRQIDYSVREELGFLGAPGGYGVEWCVKGLDRNLAYSPACHMARP